MSAYQNRTKGVSMINVNSNDRVAFIGTTGSGKSELCKSMLDRLSCCLFIDVKTEHVFTGITPYLSVEDTVKAKERKDKFIQYRPIQCDESEIIPLCKAVFFKGNMTIVFDET